MPIETKGGKPVIRFFGANSTLSLNSQRKSGSDPWEYFYTLVGPGGPMQNPTAMTNAKGEFSVKVQLVLFKDPPNCVTCTGFRQGELGIALFSGTVASPNVSSYEVEMLKFDEKLEIVDAGRLKFKVIKRDP